VILQHSDIFNLYAVAANSSVAKVAEIVRKFKVERVCMFDPNAAKELEKELGMPVLAGMEGLCELAADPKADIIINALMGAVGCLPTITAIEHGKHVALANKETMVMAGPVIWDKLAENPKSFITPIDSEHSAIFQCLSGRPEKEVEFLEITASGGPFREWPIEKFESITVADALNHPVWSMGKKITIDSASMMNKGLEVLEAHFLFHIPYEQIKVVVHPQSMVHSLVQFRDGSLMAQLGAPDMRIPIQVALTWPDRLPLETKRLDLPTLAKLTFFEPDFNKFRCLALAFEAGRRGGIVPAMMNAANEVLVDAFLKGNLKFTDIPKHVETIMKGAPTVTGHLTLDQVLEADVEARKLTAALIK
jgi:1-deoxy-D-xylulose-5-phosphate reductoisomerase